MKWIIQSLLVVLCVLVPSSVFSKEPEQKSPPQQKASVEDVIPLTMGALRGHKMLYNEGWYVVTSSSKALDYAKEKSIMSSKTALSRVATDAAKHTAGYRASAKNDVLDSAETGQVLVTGGTKLSGQILEATHELAKAELAYADDRFKKAVETFVTGNITIARRTEEERKELSGIPGNYFHTIKSDFSNIFELADAARHRFSGKIEPAWESSFRKASRQFQAEYEKSGTEHNTLTALGPVLYGYLKSFYQGLAAPASKSIVRTSVAGTSYAVFLPVTAGAVVAGRTVQSVGLTVYYAGKTGIKIISPTTESGLLSGLSLLSLSSVPVTYTAGGGLGAINQVAFTTAGPAAATVEAGAGTATHSAAYVGFVAYDAVKGTTQVVINQAASGVVLGYNALTAIPTHAVMGTLDTAVFLAYDGPRLVIASATGRIKYGKDSADMQSYSIGDLPVGTVVDLKKVEKTEGIKVDILSTDNEVIKNVLEKIPDDARAE